MSYALTLSNDAIRGLSQLEPWLAEEALDELETLTAAPEKIGKSAAASSVFDFTRQREASIHYVFLVVWANESAKVLEVRAIGHYSRASDDLLPPAGV